MPTLSESVNVYNTAVLVLREKGYQVWFEEENKTFCAERDGWDFMADSPVSLLGLVSIFEGKRPVEYGVYWWRSADAPKYTDLPRKPERFTSVMEHDLLATKG